MVGARGRLLPQCDGRLRIPRYPLIWRGAVCLITDSLLRGLREFLGFRSRATHRTEHFGIWVALASVAPLWGLAWRFPQADAFWILLPFGWVVSIFLGSWPGVPPPRGHSAAF